MTINLVIQSQNYKDISILDLNTFNNINNTVNNASVNLPYSNYILDISSSTSSYSFSSFWNNINSVTRDGLLIFFMLLLIVIALMGLKFIKKL
jgi:hypothetical protein